MKIVQTISLLFTLACGAARRLGEASAFHDTGPAALTNHHRDLGANRCGHITIKLGEVTQLETQGMISVIGAEAYKLGANGEWSSNPIGKVDWIWFKAGTVDFHLANLEINEASAISFTCSGNDSSRGGITGGSGRYKDATGDVLITKGEGNQPDTYTFRVSCDV